MAERDEYTKEIVDILQQDWKEGVHLFEEVLRSPGDLEARKKLRELERKHTEKRKKPILRIPFPRGHEDSALGCEVRLLHDPWDVECLFNLAELLHQEKAVAMWVYEDIETLVREKPDEKTLHRLAQGYESIEAWEKAAAFYRMLNAKWPRPEYERKVTSAESHPGSASGVKESYRDFIKDEEEARRLEEAGRLPKSGRDYVHRAKDREEELNAAPSPQKRIQILLEIARDYTRAGDMQHARQHYERILKIDGKNPHAIEALLQIDMAAAPNRQKAIEVGVAGYERLLKIEPTNPEFSLELGKLVLEKEDYHNAILAFQKAARHPNFRRRARSELARCFFLQGLYSLAAKEYEETLSDTGTEEAERTEARYALADCHYHMGDLQRAFELFGEVYRKQADFKDVSKRVFELRDKLGAASPPEK
jgi:tetratricopeptide (TPR) repeat protein